MRIIIKNRGIKMKYYFNLYWSEELVGKEKEILTKLEQEKVQINKYLVVLTENEVNHLEFFDSVLFKQNLFKRDNLFVVGIAEGYIGALELVEKITQDVYDVTKGTDIRRYFLTTQKEFEERFV